MSIVDTGGAMNQAPLTVDEMRQINLLFRGI